MTVLLKKVCVNDSAQHFHNRISCVVKLTQGEKLYSFFTVNDILPNRLTDCISDQLTSVFLLVLSSSPFEDNKLPIDM